jgi:hypothetical protein
LDAKKKIQLRSSLGGRLFFEASLSLCRSFARGVLPPCEEIGVWLRLTFAGGGWSGLTWSVAI